jgi:hypothetical protein
MPTVVLHDELDVGPPRVPRRSRAEKGSSGSEADFENVNGPRALLHAAAQVVMRKSAPPRADAVSG